MALISINVPSNGDLTNLLKSVRKKCPRVRGGGAGWGVQSLFGQCQNTGASILLGLPVLPKSKSMSTCIIFGQKKFDLKHR